MYCALKPKGKSQTNVYRYDGLYKATFLRKEESDNPKKRPTMTYRLIRLPCGSGLFLNKMDATKYVQHCVERGTMSKAALSFETSVNDNVKSTHQTHTSIGTWRTMTIAYTSREGV
jgi:hypothetical protein